MEGDLGGFTVDAADRDVEGPEAGDSNTRIMRENPQDEDTAPSAGETAGKGKSVVKKSTFEKLPAEIIEQ
jgi:hypothetical protein